MYIPIYKHLHSTLWHLTYMCYVGLNTHLVQLFLLKHTTSLYKGGPGTQVTSH